MHQSPDGDTKTTTPTPTLLVMSNINSLSLLALARIGGLNLASSSAAKAARAEVAPGVHAVDVTVRLRGEVRVGEDHEAAVAVSAPWRDIAVALLGKVSAPVRERTLREILGGEAPVSAEIKDEVEAAIRDIMGTTIKVVSGKVTGKVEAEEVQL